MNVAVIAVVLIISLLGSISVYHAVRYELRPHIRRLNAILLAVIAGLFFFNGLAGLLVKAFEYFGVPV